MGVQWVAEGGRAKYRSQGGHFFHHAFAHIVMGLKKLRHDIRVRWLVMRRYRGVQVGELGRVKGYRE